MGVAGISHFFSEDSVGPSLARQIKLLETLTLYLIFFSRNENVDKTAGAQAGLGICC